MSNNNQTRDGILLAANWDSNVGYAWWLMESYWLVLAGFSGKKYTCHLCYPEISVLPEAVLASSLVVHKISFIDKSTSSLLEQINFIRENRVRVIYFTDQPSFQIRYAFYRLFGVKIIINHDHTPGRRTRPSGLKKHIKTLLNRAPFFTLDAQIGVTSYVKERIISVNCFPKKKTFIVPNGIRVTDLQEPIAKFFDVRSLYSIPEDRQIIVTTSRAHLYKGIDFALRCIAKMLKEHPDMKLHYLFCGGGPHLDMFLEKAKQLGISEYVTMPGSMTNMSDILSECQIAFHPSHGEVGYSLSILEYMFAELPTLVPNNPSVCGATIDGVTGLIYSDNDVDSANRQLKLLLADEALRRRIGINAKESVCAKYNLERAHSELKKVFSAILSTKGLTT